MTLTRIIQLIPEYRDYVWGGERLRPGRAPTAEAWVVTGGAVVASGPQAARTLDELVRDYGAALLGEGVAPLPGGRFPLLIKLLDSNQWLSLQVHPDDAQAQQLEGPGQSGKTEAWHVLDAAPEARLIAGLKPGVSQPTLQAAARDGTILDMVQYLEVNTGDTLYVPAGSIHALGPGLLIYEVQQASDLTYRIYDWGRPQTGGRILHIDKSLAVANPAAAPQATPQPALAEGDRAVLCQSAYFGLELLAAGAKALHLDTQAKTFHILTVIEGRARVRAGDEVVELQRYQSALIPSASGPYRIEPIERCRLLKVSKE